MKQHWQFSIATLLVSTLIVCIAAAAIREPLAAHYAAVALFFMAAILFRFGPTGARIFWFWFSLCGFAGVFGGIGICDAVESTAFWRSIGRWLQEVSPTWLPFSPEHSLGVAHSLFAICCAVLGGIFMPVVGERFRFGSCDHSLDEATPPVGQAEQ